MERGLFEWILDFMRYKKGGTKEACVIVREFLKQSRSRGAFDALMKCNGGLSKGVDEFIEAVIVLMACAFQEEDVVLPRCRVPLRVKSDFFKKARDGEYIKEGLKEAFVIVLKFMQSARIDTEVQNLYGSCIKVKEFFGAMRVLISFAARSADQLPRRWNCNCLCDGTNSVFCSGEFNLTNDSQNNEMCPYFRMEDK